MDRPADLPVLFRDPRFVVLNKPAGLKVHAGPGGGPSVEDHFPTLSRGRAGPWLAHRLDADTSGCLVVALRRSALHAAQAAFADGRAAKLYWAVTDGVPDRPAGRIAQGLAKRTAPGGWRMVADAAAPPAVSDWEVLGRDGAIGWVAVRPRTGRTHQVRAHLAALGCPVRGDPVYGDTPGGAGPALHLLARAISLPVAPPVWAEAPVPAHMAAALRRCGWRG